MCRIAVPLTVMLMLLPLTACTAQESEHPDSSATSGAVEAGASRPAAGSNPRDGTRRPGEPDPALIAACVEQTNMGEAVCTCVARKASEELSEEEHAFLLASVREDDEETERLRGELSVQEAMRAGMFLVNAPRECAGEPGT